MRKSIKRLTALILAVLLFAGMTTGVMAAGEVYPEEGTLLVYRPNKGSGYGYVSIHLANGSKSFTIKRSDVKISKGGTGAKLTGLYKYKSTRSEQYAYHSGSSWSTSSGTYTNCNYYAELKVNHTGTAKVKYKIGSTTHALNVQVLAYQNPVKSIKLNGVKGGKNFASASKKTLNPKALKLKSNVSSAKLKVTAASGWSIQYLEIQDLNTGSYRVIYGGGTSMTLPCGKLTKTHRYVVWANFNNLSNGASMTVAYNIKGSNS